MFPVFGRSRNNNLILNTQARATHTHPQAQSAAAARLPPEPADGPSALRVAVRLPEGPRAQRRFERSNTVAALHDWVVTLSGEAAARKFVLSQMGECGPRRVEWLGGRFAGLMMRGF